MVFLPLFLFLYYQRIANVVVEVLDNKSQSTRFFQLNIIPSAVGLAVVVVGVSEFKLAAMACSSNR